MEKAMDRKQLHQQIMKNPTTDLFYRFINRIRKKTTGTTTCMEIDGKSDYSEDNQRHAFARYFEDLSIPKNDTFDNTYYDLCNIRQNLVEQFYSVNELTLQPYTNTDVSKSIDKLNTGKSSDEFGLSAEHLKHSEVIIVHI